METLKVSALDGEHRALGARMGSFGGWDMPISYAGTVGEHTAVRTSCGVFDVSHLGKILVTGQGAAALLDRALTRDIATIQQGEARYTLMLDENAGIVDDMIVYGIPEGLLVVPNASNVDEVERRLLDTQKEMNLSDADVRQTDDVILALQGPRSREVLDKVISGVPAIEYMHIAGAAPYTIARSGYTGEHGYEIFAKREDAVSLWRALLSAGVTPAGLAARDTLRLEMGYPLHGSDIDRTTTPKEALLMWAVKKNAPFTGSDALAEKQKSKTLIGILMSDRAIPRHGCVVATRDGTTLGEVTSGTFSPTLKTGIALAYVKPDAVGVGDHVSVDVRGKRGTGVVKKPPFVGSSPKT
ncbi:MAG: glycine cleavage system aminomethyltransferase GcvT [Actinomycetota bacterium]